MQIAPQAWAGYFFPYPPSLPSSKRNGGGKRKVRRIREHPSPSYGEIRALGLQARWLLFPAPERTLHFTHTISLTLVSFGDRPLLFFIRPCMRELYIRFDGTGNAETLGGDLNGHEAGTRRRNFPLPSPLKRGGK